MSGRGAELVTNGTKYVRAYDPRTGTFFGLFPVMGLTSPRGCFWHRGLGDRSSSSRRSARLDELHRQIHGDSPIALCQFNRMVMTDPDWRRSPTATRKRSPSGAKSKSATTSGSRTEY
jgi:hypothetical protein